MLAPLATDKSAYDALALVPKSTSTVFAVIVIAPELLDVTPIPLAPVNTTFVFVALPVPVN